MNMELSINRKYGTIFYTKRDSKIFGRLGIKVIVIHSTAGKTAAGAIAWFNNKTRKKGSSSHYVIDTDGSIFQLLDEEDVSWHAGASAWAFDGFKHDQINRWSIGIEVACEENGIYTKEQLESLKNLTQDIMNRHKIALANVVRHSDITLAGKRDPYPANLNWDLFKQSLKSPMFNELDVPLFMQGWKPWDKNTYNYAKSVQLTPDSILQDVDEFLKMAKENPEIFAVRVMAALINVDPNRKAKYAAFVKDEETKLMRNASSKDH